MLLYDYFKFFQGEDEEPSRKELVDQLMKDPQVLASLQDRLHKYLGNPSGYVEVILIENETLLFFK